MAETTTILGLLAVGVTSVSGLVLALINGRVSKGTAQLSSEDNIRKGLLEQVTSLSNRLESEIEHRDNCEQEKSALRIAHDKQIQELMAEHSKERHALRAQVRAFNVKFLLLMEALERRGITIDEEELNPKKAD